MKKLLLAGVISFATSMAPAATYYVSTAGNDSDAGTVAQPWKTIQHAANTLQAGDTVCIRAGAYTEVVSPARSGTSGAWITYSAYPGEERQVVVTGGVTILQKSFIKVAGLKIVGPRSGNSPTAGIYVEGPGVSNITISGNWTYDTGGAGIAAWGVPWGQNPGAYNWKAISKLIIESNLVEMACDPVLPGGGWNEQLDIVNGVDDFEVRQNILRNGGVSSVDGSTSPNGGEGIDLKEGASNGKVWGNEIYNEPKYGIYLDAGASRSDYYPVAATLRNIQVYNNKVHHVTVNGGAHGIGITSEGRGNLDGIAIYNNLVYENGADGILVYHYPAASGFANNISVINNTVYHNATITTYYGGIAIDSDVATNVVVRNNIVFGNNGFDVKLPGQCPAAVYDHNLTTDPMFVNTAGSDFHLQSGSPAKNAGSATGAPATDFDGVSRPQESAVDIGAYEYAVVAITYYVSPGGSDSNAGTQSAPFKTVQKGVTAASPGDTIILMDGTYGSGGQTSGFAVWIDSAHSGTSPAWITLKAQHKGQAILDGGNTVGSAVQTGCSGYIDLDGASYWIIQDLVFRNTFDSGINANSDVTAEHDVIIRGCEFYNIGRHSTAGMPSEGTGLDGVYVGNYGSLLPYNFTFEGNIFHDIGRTGATSPTDPGVIGHDHGLYLHCQNCTIINNIFYAPFTGWGIQTASGFSGTIANNVFYGQMWNLRTSQIMLWGEGNGLTGIGPTIIRNNIFYDPTGGTAITCYNPNFQSTCNIDHNITYSGTIGSVPGATYGTNLDNTDSLFVNASGHDFHLQSGSPAIDFGVAVSGITNDFDGVSRPQGAAFDIGAFEYVVSVPQPPVITSATAATGTVNQAFSYQISTSGSPTNYNATGLPSGLSINRGTGIINGTPATNGTSSVTISAINGAGTGTATLTITINASTPGPSGLVGWWKLDESSGATAADSSGNGNNGTLSGGTWQASGGHIAGALHLNAFDVVNCGAGASLNTPSVTVAFWMKPDSMGNVIPVDKLPNSGSVGYAVKLRDNGSIWFRVGAEGGSALDVYGANGIYTNGVWTHVACTFDAATGNMRMYINGVVESHQPTYAVTLNASNTTFRMGSTVEQYAGLLDDVRVYDHALTLNEIVTVMAGGGSVAELIQFVPAGMSAGSTGCSFSWSGSPGATNSFKVYRSTNLVGGSWQLVAPSVARSGTGTNLWMDTNVFQRAFYRVATPNQ